MILEYTERGQTVIVGWYGNIMRLFNKRYKFTDKKISRGGVMSSLFALIAAGLLCAGVYISYKADGNGGANVGVLGMSAFLVALIGFIIGVRSFKEGEVYLGFPWFGVVANAIIWIFMAGVVLVGL